MEKVYPLIFAFRKVPRAVLPPLGGAVEAIAAVGDAEGEEEEYGGGGGGYLPQDDNNAAYGGGADDYFDGGEAAEGFTL